MCARVHAWKCVRKLENNFVDLMLFLYNIDPGDLTQVSSGLVIRAFAHWMIFIF